MREDGSFIQSYGAESGENWAAWANTYDSAADKLANQKFLRYEERNHPG